MPKEHAPPRALLMLMSAFFWSICALALSFWCASLLWLNGAAGLVASLGAGPTAIFVVLHIMAAIVGVLLWQWRRGVMPPRRRVLMETGLVYFGVAVFFSTFMNYLALAALDKMM